MRQLQRASSRSILSLGSLRRIPAILISSLIGFCDFVSRFSCFTTLPLCEQIGVDLPNWWDETFCGTQRSQRGSKGSGQIGPARSKGGAAVIMKIGLSSAPQGRVIIGVSRVRAVFESIQSPSATSPSPLATSSTSSFSSSTTST